MTYDYNHTSLKLNKTEQEAVLSVLPKVIKRLSKIKNPCETDLLEWQMIGAFFVENKLPITKDIKNSVLNATSWLKHEHASSFIHPHIRRKVLSNFETKLLKLKTSKSLLIKT